MRTDLHSHTTASDGTLTPSALVALAAGRDIAVLAVTDHDTTAGLDEARAAGAREGVRVIGGIEISALLDNKEVHMLGYGVAASDAATRDIIAGLRQVRVARAQSMLKKLAALGMPVEFAQVQAMAGDGIIGRPHIARALIAAGYVQTMPEAFDNYLAEGKPAFTANDALTPAEAIALIHAAHGCAVLAHPLLFKGDFEALFEHARAAGLDGIEAHYPMHNAPQTAQYSALAVRHGMIVTGGSDFHSDAGYHDVALGTVHLPDGVITALDARIARYA